MKGVALNLKQTPLHDCHIAASARMVEFAGWHMPVQYRSALQEHLTVRKAVGIFDVSHMGELEIRGADAAAEVQRLTCNDLDRVADGQAQYSAFLTPQGTFVDDIVVYRFSAAHILICVNAANKDKDFQWVRDNLQGAASVRDRSHEFAQIAVQGPRAQEVLQSLTRLDLASIRYYWFQTGAVADVDCIVSRTGYTGEDGFEVYAPPAGAAGIWNALLDSGRQAGIEPAGLAARNTLRLEACLALYGNDIDETTTPLEAGLSWMAKLEAGDFIGRSALLSQKEEGLSRKLSAFEVVDRGIARDGHVVWAHGEPVGRVTSGGFAPSIQKSVGMAYLPFKTCDVGSRIEVDVRGKHLAAAVVKKPFYKRFQ